MSSRRQRAGLIDHAPGSGGTATSASAAKTQPNSSASKEALAAFIAVNRMLPSYLAGAAGAGAGAGLKSTFGAVEISFSFSTAKFGFSL